MRIMLELLKKNFSGRRFLVIFRKHFQPRFCTQNVLKKQRKQIQETFIMLSQLLDAQYFV